MKFTFLVAPVLALALASGCAHKPVPEATAPLKVIEENATLPFANYRSTIRDWVERDDGSLLIRSNNNRWYQATFLGSCPWLSTAQRIGFKTDASGQLDKFSEVLVEGQKCPFQSFREVEDPRPPKA